MLLLPLLAALLGGASAAQPQPQQPLGPADDTSSLTVPQARPVKPAPPPPPPPVSAGRRDPECRTLNAVVRGVDAAVEGAVHAGVGGLTSLYVCRRADGRDCGLVAASLFLLLTQAGGFGGGFGGFSADDVAFYASACSLAYLLYLSVWSGLASRRTGAWLSVTFFQALILLYRGFRDGVAPGEQTRLLLLGGGQTLFCVLTFLLSAFRMATL